MVVPRKQQWALLLDALRSTPLTDATLQVRTVTSAWLALTSGSRMRVEVDGGIDRDALDAIAPSDMPPAPENKSIPTIFSVAGKVVYYECGFVCQVLEECITCTGEVPRCPTGDQREAQSLNRHRCREFPTEWVSLWSGWRDSTLATLQSRCATRLATPRLS